MSTATWLGLALALASTTAVNLAYVRQREAAAEMPPLSLRRPVSSVRKLLASREWLIGFGMETGGFALYVAALALAPLALVQCVGAGGVGVLALAGARAQHRRPSRREGLGAGLAIAGLALLAASLASAGAEGGEGSLGAIAIWLGATIGAAAAVWLFARGLLGRGVAAGVAGGLLFAAGDVATKIATEGGARALFGLVLIGAYLLGTALLQIGYQSGSALTVAGIATLLTNAIPIAAGTVLLGEPLPSGAAGAARVAAFAAVTAGAILLARPTGPHPGRAVGDDCDHDTLRGAA